MINTFWDQFRGEGGGVLEEDLHWWDEALRFRTRLPTNSSGFQQWSVGGSRSVIRAAWASWAVSSAKNGLMDTERFPYMKRGLSADCSGKTGKGLYVGGAVLADCSFFFSHHHTFIFVPLVSIAAFVCTSDFFFFIVCLIWFCCFSSVCTPFCLYFYAFFLVWVFFFSWDIMRWIYHHSPGLPFSLGERGRRKLLWTFSTFRVFTEFWVKVVWVEMSAPLLFWLLLLFFSELLLPLFPHMYITSAGKP